MRRDGGLCISRDEKDMGGTAFTLGRGGADPVAQVARKIRGPSVHARVSIRVALCGGIVRSSIHTGSEKKVGFPSKQRVSNKILELYCSAA